MIIDHTETVWSLQQRASGRHNGALTYSRDIVKWQAPLWTELFPDAIVSTAPNLIRIQPPPAPVYVQYFHTPKWNKIENFVSMFPNGLPITAYKEMYNICVSKGINAVYLPMTLDTDEVTRYEADGQREGIIYFGNVVTVKRHTYANLRKEFGRIGRKFITISHDRINGTLSTRPKILEFISTFKYGMGVGRCAQEMMALGLKIIVVGRQIGGVATTESEYQTQLGTNWNSQVPTGSQNVKDCLKRLPNAVSRAEDIRHWIPYIRDQISQAVEWYT